MTDQKIDDTLSGQNVDPEELSEDDRMNLRREIDGEET
jgi:hypothetical protein